MTCKRCNDTGQVSISRHGPLFPSDVLPCANCCKHDGDTHCRRCGLILVKPTGRWRYERGTGLVFEEASHG